MTTRSVALRVPEIGALFWIVKLLTTGIGETSSDFLVRAFDPVPVVLLAAAVFAACLALQLSAARYVPWRYWLFVAMVAVFGTMVADVTHIVLDVPYAVSSTAFALVLAALLITWRRVEGTISVHSISTVRRELFYWGVVLATFALGTAFGDLTATVFGFGYLGSGILFAALFAIPLALHSGGKVETLSFWCAYVLTRPLGASFADWIAVDHTRGGLALGTGQVSVVGLLIMAALISWMQVLWKRARRTSKS